MYFRITKSKPYLEATFTTLCLESAGSFWYCWNAPFALYFYFLMIVLYNTGLFFLRLGFRIAALFHVKAKAFVAGRNNIIGRLKEAFHGNRNPIVWVHCASLGEFEQGRPIIESLKKEYPTIKVLLTFFSPSGYEVRKNYNQAD